MVLAGWQSPGAKRQTQEGVACWPEFDPDSAEEPGLVEPYLSAIRVWPLFPLCGGGCLGGIGGPPGAQRFDQGNAGRQALRA